MPAKAQAIQALGAAITEVAVADARVRVLAVEAQAAGARVVAAVQAVGEALAARALTEEVMPRRQP